MNIALIDKLCVFPVIQQVIGLATVLSNIVLLIIDLAKSVWGRLNFSKSNLEGLSLPSSRKINVLDLIKEREAAGPLNLTTYLLTLEKNLEKTFSTLGIDANELQARIEEIEAGNKAEKEELNQSIELFEKKEKECQEKEAQFTSDKAQWSIQKKSLKQEKERLAQAKGSGALEELDRQLEEELTAECERLKGDLKAQKIVLRQLTHECQELKEIRNRLQEEYDFNIGPWNQWIAQREEHKALKSLIETHATLLEGLPELAIYDTKAALNESFAKLHEEQSELQKQEMAKTSEFEEEKKKICHQIRLHCEREELLHSCIEYSKVLKNAHGLSKECDELHAELKQQELAGQQQSGDYIAKKQRYEDLRGTLETQKSQVDAALTVVNHKLGKENAITLESSTLLDAFLNEELGELGGELKLLQELNERYKEKVAAFNTTLEKDKKECEKKLKDLEDAFSAYEVSIEELKKEGGSESIKEPQIVKILNGQAIYEHLKYIGIGFLRMIPIAGTVYSSIVWYRENHRPSPPLEPLFSVS